MKGKAEKLPPLQQGLLMAMQALDKQIARELQRTPAQTEIHGVQKWEPHSRRIENVCAVVFDALEERSVELDSILVLSQAFAKCLQMYVDDIGTDGLGKIRAAYCLHALESIARDVARGEQVLKGEAKLN